MNENYTLTVKFAPEGTPLAGGKPSGPGHMWYELRDGNGNVHSYGWSPGDSKFKPGIDNLGKDDFKKYIADKDHPITSITMSISKEQYDILRKYPYDVANGKVYEIGTGYEIISNSCIDFVAIGLSKAKLVDSNFEGGVLLMPASPQNVKAFRDQILKNATPGKVIYFENIPLDDGGRKVLDTNRFQVSVPSRKYESPYNITVPDNYPFRQPKRHWADGEKLKKWHEQSSKGKKYYIYDPLALDLDGNGLTTTAAAGFSGSLFDHTGSGIRTASGWLDKTDGFLVYDRNGDGIINNGGELFGDNTRLQNGSLAEHGFAALADLDSNGDGKIDSDDQAFSSLRVWKNANQDRKIRDTL